MSVIGCLALVAAIANSAASVGFPIGARWERVVNALVTVDLLVITVVLVVGAVLTSRKVPASAAPTALIIDQQGSETALRPRTGVLVIAGLLLLGLDWVLWLAFGLTALVGGLIESDASYRISTTVIAVFGPLWVLGTVAAVIGFHRGGSRRNRQLALLGAVLTVTMMGVVVLTALLFALGMID